MPKIRDLGVSTIPLNYVFAGSTINNPPEQPPCSPSKPQCHPTKKPKNAGALPQHAVAQLRQQLQHHIGGELHS